MNYALKHVMPWLVLLVTAMATAIPHSNIRVPAGTMVTIRLERAISSDRNATGEQFTASLAVPLMVNGRVLAKQGSAVRGQIVRASGRSGVSADLILELKEIALANGRFESIATEPLERRNEARSTGWQSWNWSAMGTSIGAAVGKGRGAALGATIGASSRGLSATGTRAHAVVINPSDLLVFRLR
jgi:hypothetical protein